MSKHVRWWIAAGIVYVVGFGATWNVMPPPGARCSKELTVLERERCRTERNAAETNRIFASVGWPLVAPVWVSIRLTDGWLDEADNGER